MSTDNQGEKASEQKKSNAASSESSNSNLTENKGQELNTEKSDELNKSQTGLSQQLGKPVYDKQAESLESRTAEIESQYKQLKYKKFAQSAISSAFGDIFAAPSTEKEDSQNSESDKTKEQKSD